MSKLWAFVVAAALCLTLPFCAGHKQRPLIDPSVLTFPLAEAGTLELEGEVVGQPRARDGVVYVATNDGFLTAIVVPSLSVLWRRPGSEALSGPTETGVLEDRMRPVLRVDGEHLRAFDGKNAQIWEFDAGTTIAALPAVAGKRVFFGALDRMFYGLDAATGKVRWRRRLQGAPLNPAIIVGRTIAVAASNSVVYFLSSRGGSILSWEIVPSRVVYELAAAGQLVLVSSASPEVTVLDVKSGKRVGQYLAPEPLVAGAVWSPPYVVLFEENHESGRQRIVVLRSR